MEKLILLMSIICFISSSFFLVAKITKTSFFLTLTIRIIGILGVSLPLLYWFKLTQII